MTYSETLDYLYGLLPVFHRDGKAALKPGLENTLALCQHLGNPQTTFKSVHVAGTNGKGSSSHYLSAILQSTGLKVGLYTSPHLVDFRERFKINGQWIEEKKVIDFVQVNREWIERHKPSFFELCVGLAFAYFETEKVDIAIIETGLGGRLDSTNVINPILSLITNIGLDHADILGDTLEQIAFEKAGIIKKNTPIVVSEHINASVDQIFINKALELNAPITFAEERFNSLSVASDPISQTISINDEIYKTDQLGIYQKNNLKGVLAAIDQLKASYHIPKKAVLDGIERSKKLSGLRGRWEIINHHPLTIADIGHNEHGLKINIEQLKSSLKNLIFVLGFLKDKDLTKILALFPKNATYYFTEPDSLRALKIEDLIQMTSSFAKSFYLKNPNEALEKATLAATKDDLIYVGGSTFVVSSLNYFKNG